MYMRGSESIPDRTGGSNPDVAIIIPSTGRAEQCARLVERIYETARTWPHVTISIEPDDVKPYAHALMATSEQREQRYTEHGSLVGLTWDQTGTAGPGSHVPAINRAAASHTERSYCPNDTNGDGDCAQCARRPDAHSPKIIIKLDDDHWPVTVGWDVLYLNALNDKFDGTGVVYGNDLFQGPRLPTVPGISTDIVQELGWYAPPQLGHWHCDDFWRELGGRSGRLCYLPNVIIEHRNVQAGKAPNDETYALGGLNRDRIDADGRVWAKMISQPAPDAAAVGRDWPSQMDIWADRVVGLAARKGWKP